MKKTFIILAAAVVLYAGTVRAESAAYQYCMKDASKIGDSAIAECMKAENGRLNQQIYKEYEQISLSPDFIKWNNGSGMFRGRLKSLYENWSKYRDEYCDLYVLSMSNYTGSTEYNKQSCLLDANKTQLLQMSSVPRNYNSTPE